MLTKTVNVYGKIVLIAMCLAMALMGCASHMTHMAHSQGAREVFNTPLTSSKLKTVSYTNEEIDFEAVVLPPQSITTLKLKTYCLDHYRSAPPAGEKMKMLPVESLIDSELVPLYVELMKYSHQDSAHYRQIQRIVWNFRHAVTEKTQALALQPEDRELLRSLYPESESVLRRFYAKKTAQDLAFKVLEAFLSPEGKKMLSDLQDIGIDLSQPKRTCEDADRNVDEILTALETMSAGHLPSAQDNAYSFLEDGVAVQVSHSGGARSTNVTIRNTTDHSVTFQPANYVYDSAEKHQPLASGGIEEMEQQKEQEDFGNIFFHVGRICHLIQDMTAPSHIHSDPHPNGDTVEVEIEEHLKKHIKAYVERAKSSDILGVPTIPDIPIPEIPLPDNLQPRRPSNSGLPGLGVDVPEHFLRNVAFRTYVMTSYYGGHLQKAETQPDSELMRMFPDLQYRESLLETIGHADIGNDCWDIEGIGEFCVDKDDSTDEEGNNSWWQCPRDAGYFYLEEVEGAIPLVFKKDKFQRITEMTDLDSALQQNWTSCKLSEQSFRKFLLKSIPPDVIAALSPLKDQEFTRQEDFFQAVEAHLGHERAARYQWLILQAADRFGAKTLPQIYVETLFPLAIEWTAGFLEYVDEEISKAGYVD